VTIDPKGAYPLAVRYKLPSAQNIFGTDFSAICTGHGIGLWQTALIGIIAGTLGTAIGVVLPPRHTPAGYLTRRLECRSDAYPSLLDPGHHCRLAR
jgi:hypothetical protein